MNAFQRIGAKRDAALRDHFDGRPNRHTEPLASCRGCCYKRAAPNPKEEP